MVITVTPPPITIDNGCAADVPPKLSFTVTLNEAVAAVLGVPLITPLDAFKLKPAGSAPLLTVQLLYGGVPPVAANVWLYATPTVPPGSDVVRTDGPAITVMESGCAGEVFPRLSLTVTLNEEVPVALGVPLITPLEEFRLKPPGSDPLLTVQLLYGCVPPLADRV